MLTGTGRPGKRFRIRGKSVGCGGVPGSGIGVVEPFCSVARNWHLTVLALSPEQKKYLDRSAVAG